MSPPQVRILFVCLGNICRSPSAEGLFRARAAELGLQHAIETDSAGSIPFQVGKPPDRRAQQVARAHGVDLSDLRARLVSPEDFERFDHIIAMDKMNLADLKRACPPARLSRLSMMMSHAPQPTPAEVPDPYGGEASFEHVWQLLDQAVKGLMTHVRNEHVL